MTSNPASSVDRVGSWHVAVAAEAFAAGAFARCGIDVSVQYGADQPEYDLIVASGDRMLKVSVKGSQDGAWGLTQSYLSDGDYQGAVDQWLARHKSRTVLCLVQFKDVPLNELPRIYIATPAEVAARLRETASGRGATILYERHEWGTRAYAAGSVEQIPAAWKFSRARVEHLLEHCA